MPLRQEAALPPGAANLPYDLAESTTRELSLGDLLDLLGGPGSLTGVRLGYGPAAGSPALRRSVAKVCGVEAGQVLTTQGTMLGLCLLASELCRAGDEVVLVSPCFAPMASAFERGGGRVRRVALRFDDGYRLEAARIGQALGPATRLVAIASPQNPSGVRVPGDALRDILAAMAVRAPGALLLIDETYREATYGEAPPASSAALDPRVVTAGSLSKAHGVPGLRIGWLTVHDPALRDRLTAAKAGMVISGSALDESIAAALLERGDRALAPRRRRLARALEKVGTWRAAECGRLDWVRPEAGALCCMRLRADAFGAEAVERFWAVLPHHRLRLAPGGWFGETSDIFRLGFGHLPLADLVEALAALSCAMDEAAAAGAPGLSAPRRGAARRRGGGR